MMVLGSHARPDAFAEPTEDISSTMSSGGNSGDPSRRSARDPPPSQSSLAGRRCPPTAASIVVIYSHSASAAATVRAMASTQAEREAERLHLLGLFQQAPGFLCFLRGPELVMELANDAYMELVGGDRDIIGKPLRDALPEIRGQGFFELLERVHATGEPFVGRRMGVTLERTAGTPEEAVVDFIYQPIVDDDGDVSGVLVQGTDVTDVVHQEEERRAAEERFTSLFQSLDDAYCLVQVVFDEDQSAVDYRFLDMNDAFELHTGLTNATGRLVREVLPDLDSAWIEAYGEVVRTGVPARMEREEPSMGRWFECLATRIGLPEHRQVALIFKDITRRKELMLREQEARRAAEDANRMKDEFLTMVSHELRTPLSAIVGWTQMLQAGTLSPEKQAAGVAVIARNSAGLAELVDDLLDVGRILSGKLQLNLERVALERIVEQAVDTIRPAADARHLQVIPVLGQETWVVGDPDRLRQVAWNLLSNAVKFTPKGGSIRVSVERRGSWVEITVSDSGEGIDPSFLPHLFERFRQREGGSTRRVGGLGLGLSIVKHVVEAHGGTVEARSDGEGKGSTFVIKLPLSVALREPNPRDSGEFTASDSGSSLNLPQIDGVRVLVVDDQSDAREMIGTLLESCGGTVRLESSAMAALDAIRSEDFDVMISDIGMPTMDGYALIRAIRALERPASRNLPSIASTAYARKEDRTQALLAGFSSYVSKPVDARELLAVINALARQYRGTR